MPAGSASFKIVRMVPCMSPLTAPIDTITFGRLPAGRPIEIVTTYGDGGALVTVYDATDEFAPPLEEWWE